MIRHLILLVALFTSLTATAAEPRLSLTASDGTGLVLTRLQARVVLEGFLAFTELELVFHNPENRRREGRFQMVLPEGAAISRFAMEVGGYLQEGEVVETDLARRAYEDFLHRRQDPALLETDRGNRFNARIFPIEPLEDKRLILSYSQRLTAGDYVLPLAGLPQLRELEIRLYHDVTDGDTRQVGGFSATTRRREVLTVSERDYTPTEDFRVPRALSPGLTLRSGELLASLLVPVREAAPAPVADLTLLVDTSASQSPHLAGTVARLTALLEALAPDTVRVIAFDQEVVDLGEAGDAAGWRALLVELAERPALGASRLDAALGRLATLETVPARLLVVSDMVLTAGQTTAQPLVEQLTELAGLQRLDILLPGYHRDRALAEVLTRAGEQPGLVAVLDDDIPVLARALQQDLATDLPVTVSGADWHWPETVPALQTGEPVLVFASLAAGVTPEIRVAGERQDLRILSAEPLLLHREAVRGRLDKLLAMEDASRDADLKRALHREIIDLSVRKRVLSPYTSLLVLETEADYARYGIDRRGLAEILTVGADGLEVIQREGRQGGQAPVIAMPLPEPQPMQRLREEAVDDTRGDTASAPPAGAVESVVPTQQAMPAAPPAPTFSGLMAAEPEMNGDAFVDEVGVEASEVGTPMIAEEPAARRAPAPASAPALNRMFRGAPGGASDESGEAITSVSPELQQVAESVGPWSGRYASFRERLDRDPGGALAEAWDWRGAEPADLMALIALGEAAAATGDTPLAARAYGSLVDFFPGRADIRRWAAERLLALEAEPWLAVDSLEKALADRPDHPSAHLLLALARWQAGQAREAVATLDAALERQFGRFPAAEQILRETRDLLLAVLAEQGRLAKLLPEHAGRVGQLPAELRFLLVWETDANDVDLHVYDGQGNHAYYQQMRLASGGRLYADVTTGYGPEAFRIQQPGAFPYRLGAHYYNRGPMGYGMGVMLVLDYRPGEGLAVDIRPFVVMNDGAMVELGEVNR